MKTKLSIQKDGDEFSAKDLEKNIKTYITHNKGGKWEVIKAPTQDSEGKKIDCYVEENCGLNLQIYSSNGVYAPPYSQETAVGIIMAVGNVGHELERTKNDRINTYLSRDGGLTW